MGAKAWPVEPPVAIVTWVLPRSAAASVAGSRSASRMRGPGNARGAMISWSVVF
jgi:hypothetical protein